MSFFVSLIGALFSSLFQAVATAWRSGRQRTDLDGAHERAGTAEAANETQQTIAEIADARSNLPSDSGDPDALARSLRSRKASSGRGDPSGPGQDDSEGAKG